MTTPIPIQETDRYQSLDMIRGVALFGILLMNITGFGLPFAYGNPTIYGGATGVNLWAWITTNMFFEGTQRGMFSILFGAGFLVLIQRLEKTNPTDAADIFYRRTLWMILFGMIHAYLLLWTGEILYFYGVTGLFLYPLRKLSSRAMLAVAAAGFAIGMFWNGCDNWRAQRRHAAYVEAQKAASPTPEQQEAIKVWKEHEEHFKPSPEKIAKDIAAHQGGYFGLVAYQAPINAENESWFLYRWFFDVFSMMLLGMGLLKLGVLTLRSEPRVYWLMLICGYALGLSVNYWETTTIINSGFSIFAYMTTDITYDIGRVGMTTGHLGFLLLFCRSGMLSWLRNSLAAVGRMALSNYITHSIVCAIAFSGFGFGMYAKLERHQRYYIVFSIWVFQLIMSPIWLRNFQFGPLEWGWRTLTYMKKQPMRRSVAEPVAEAV
ncbi:MAG: DUF418 domain-containing protein [Acidobacteria bacterium]|nr:DUF418 domain-containing protein [Acidobacteriota bacterium]